DSDIERHIPDTRLLVKKTTGNIGIDLALLQPLQKGNICIAVEGTDILNALVVGCHDIPWAARVPGIPTDHASHVFHHPLIDPEVDRAIIPGTVEPPCLKHSQHLVCAVSVLSEVVPTVRSAGCRNESVGHGLCVG